MAAVLNRSGASCDCWRSDRDGEPLRDRRRGEGDPGVAGRGAAEAGARGRRARALSGEELPVPHGRGARALSPPRHAGEQYPQHAAADRARRPPLPPLAAARPALSPHSVRPRRLQTAAPARLGHADDRGHADPAPQPAQSIRARARHLPRGRVRGHHPGDDRLPGPRRGLGRGQAEHPAGRPLRRPHAAARLGTRDDRSRPGADARLRRRKGGRAVTSVAVLETISIVTPLAVRLRDEATLTFFSDGLAAIVYPQGAPELAVSGTVNRAGLFVFRNLPGLRRIEQGSGDADFWAANPPQASFVLEVSDVDGRFLPWSLPVKLPQRSVLGLGLTSPPASPITVQTGGETASLPLYSAASRPAPEGLGVLRAELWDADLDEPAAWALIEAQAGEQRRVTGLADADGRVMLPLPYPKPPSELGSPLGAGGPITRQPWPVAFSVG